MAAPETRTRSRIKPCPHCGGSRGRCNDRDGRVAAYMERLGRGDEWREALRREPLRSGEKR